jgi:hypothetical protein
MSISSKAHPKDDSWYSTKLLAFLRKSMAKPVVDMTTGIFEVMMLGTHRHLKTLPPAGSTKPARDAT